MRPPVVAGPGGPAATRSAFWSVVGVCALVAGLGSSLAAVVGYVATTLRADLGLSRGAVGILSSVFFGATGAAAFASGALVDRIGATRAVVAQMALVALGCAGAAAVGTYAALLVAGLIGGVGYALGVAGTNVAIVGRIRAADQARALSLRTVGVAAFSMPCSLLAPGVADRIGWRPILVAVAVVAVAATPVVMWVLAATPERTRPVAPAAPSGGATSPRLPRRFVWFPIGAFFFVAGVQAHLSWVVPYLSESVGLDEGDAGVVVTVAIGVAIVAVLAVLRHGDAAPGRRLPKVVLLCGASAVCTLFIGLGDWLGPVSVAAGLAVSTASSLIAAGAMLAAAADAVPDAVGRATGVVMTGYFLGSVFAPTAFGLLVDVQDGYGLAWASTAAAFGIGAFAFQQARPIEAVAVP